MGIKREGKEVVITAWSCSKHGELGPELTDVVNHRVFQKCFRVCNEVEVRRYTP